MYATILERLKKYENTPYFITLLIIGLILTLPLLDTKVIIGHDAIFHISRIIDISEALKAGTFPVRIYVDNRHFWGQPNGIFYPSFFLYFPAIIKCFGLPIEICFNLLIIVAFFVGLFSSWYGFSILTSSKKIGLISAVLYISSGYFLFDAYIRSAIGELLSLSFMPLAFASMYIFVNKPKLSIKKYLIGVFSFSAVIESHVLNSAIFLLLSGFLLFGVFAKQKNIKTIMIRLSGMVFVIFLINASFIIPFLVYYKNVPVTIGGISNFKNTGWSFEILKSFLLYWNFWLLTGLLLFIFFRFIPINFTSSPKGIHYPFFARYFFAGLFFFWLSSRFFPWHLIPGLERLFRTMQFSWRFLGFATMFSSVCSGYILYNLYNKYLKKYINIKPLLFAVCISLVISLTHFVAFNNVKFFTIPWWVIGNKTYCSSSLLSKMITSDYDYLFSDINRKDLLRQGNNYSSDAIISNYRKNLTTISLTYKTEKSTKIILPLVNYPGYIAIDQYGNRIPLQKRSSNHMITVPLTERNGSIKVYYEGLPIFKAGDYISVVSIIMVVFLAFRTQKKF